MSHITVTISELTSEGTGLGFLNGKKVFVPGAFPGETVTLEPVIDKPGYISGKLLSVQKRSPDRIPDFCAVKCGGCSFTALSYEAELRFKSAYLMNLFRDLPGFSEEKYRGITGMPNPFRYRNKAVYVAGWDNSPSGEPELQNRKAGTGNERADKRNERIKGNYSRKAADETEDRKEEPAENRGWNNNGNGRFMLGLYERDSHKIISVPDCLLEPSWMNRARNGLRDLVNETISGRNSSGGDVREMKIFSEKLRYLFLRGAPDGEKSWEDDAAFRRCAVLVLRTGNDAATSSAAVPEAVLSFLEQAGIANIAVNFNNDPGNRIFGESFQAVRGGLYAEMPLLGRVFRVRPESFFQINGEITGLLYDKAIELLDPAPEVRIADLYSGIGTISFRLSDRVRETFGIEVVPEAVRDAERNSESFGIGNARFYVGRVEDVLPDLVKSGVRFDGVILDPARKGLDESVAETLAALGVPRIVYISCNPKTQKRDMAWFIKRGYQLECLYAFDMFPHTCHTETVALLLKE
ncbi:23S rRNA (uracil(1939)-C(5))-methyltransferase RlmD [Succinimonas sp.]|uniref:23S rRNA (uracil(1939)-C(5))-methyltransferase RlmD n=1 Tax=Succinimonas sp. TaxID=1936151 RepID=UPI00386A928E